MGNELSPEKDELEEPTPAAEPLSSSPEVMLVDAGRASGQQAMLATPPMEDTSIPEDADSLTARKNSNAETHGNMPHEVEGTNPVKIDGSEDAPTLPIHEDSTRAHDERIHSPDGHDDSLPDSEYVHDETVRHTTQTSSRGSSLSKVSSISPPSATDSNDSEGDKPPKDNSRDAIWSNSTSDVGLDGAVMSRIRQTTQPPPMASEIGRRWVEMQDAASNLRKTEKSSQSDEFGRLETPRGESRVESGQVPRDESVELRDGVRFRAEAVIPSVDQLPRLFNDSGKQTQDTKPSSRDVQIDNPHEDKAQPIDSDQIRKPERADRAVYDEEAQIKNVLQHDQGLDVNASEQARSFVRGGSMVTQNQSDEGLPGAEEILESTAIAGVPTQPAQSRLEVGDLDSEDETNSQHHLSATTDLRPSSHVPQDISKQVVQSIESKDILMKDNNHGEAQQKSQPEISSSPAVTEPFEADKNDSDQANAELASIEEPVSDHRGEEDAVSRQQQPANLSQISHHQSPPTAVSEGIASGTVGENVAFSQFTSDTAFEYPQSGSEELLPLQEIPSTVPNTYENPLTSQNSSNNESQNANLMPELKARSSLLLSADEPVPTLDLANTISPTATPPEFDTLEQLDRDSSHDQPTESSPTNTQAKGYDDPGVRDLGQLVSKHIATESESQVYETMVGAERDQGSSPRSKLETPASNVTDRQSSTRQSSSLIARLKEMRRLSSHTPRRQSGGGSAKQWFAPQASNQTDSQSEAGSDPPTKSSGRVQEHPIKTPPRATPEQREKRLSQSFIRSSPPQSPSIKSLSSFTQESQYLPPSQVATGFRTNFSYFVPLASLHNHYGTIVDVLVIAISSTAITRAKSGPKDYNQTLYLSDPSSTSSNDPTALTKAQIFRPQKPCFPSIGSGDAILLRNFKVHSFQKALSLISTEASAWAVFRQDADVQIRGSPVEYGPEERAFARAQRTWWATLDVKLRDQLSTAAPKTKTDRAQKGLGFDLTSKSQQPTTSSKGSDGVPGTSPKYRSLRSGKSLEPPEAEQEEVEAKEATKNRRVLRSRTAQAQSNASPEKDDLPKVEEIHELRDGTKYVDRKGVEVGDVETQRGVHELRDGTKYRDRVKD